MKDYLQAQDHFWEQAELSQLSAEQWELLCDGCGRCCLHKLLDQDSQELHYTRVHCQLLDPQLCRCKHYQQRLEKVPDCVDLRALDIANFDWLPPTCAYRLLSEHKPLPHWHHLLCGSDNSVHQAGVSVRDWSVSELHVHPEELEDQVIRWTGEGVQC